MPSHGGTRVAKPRGAILVPALVVAVVVAVGISLWSRGDLNGLICDGDCGPANVVPPRSLTTSTEPADLASGAPSPGDVDRAKLEAAVGPTLRASVLGPRIGFSAVSPSDGTELMSAGSGPYVPASTTKVLTGFAALSLIDPQTRFATRVVRSGDEVVLVGGGDPYLAVERTKKDDPVVRADLRTLAARAAEALERDGTSRVSVGFDASLFAGPAESPGWEPTYVSQNIVTPVSALWADQGVQDGVRAGEPAAAAARTFAKLLADRGITVTGEPAPAEAPQGASTLAVVRSATVARIVETLMRISDNQAAEVMLRQAAIAAGKPATFDGGAEAVTEVLDSADVSTEGLRLNDGSGLSRRNRITPLTLAQAVNVAASTARTSALVTDLPVSGFTGTLVDRFSRLTSSLGMVRAKTGTLTGVHSLAGYALDAGGRPVVFAVMADRTSKVAPFEAQAALDKVAAAIADCNCG
ncbi:D-alanyl-D-alanine carboxypeptidase/D-alanyl-D-alanine-endopeptidase [Aeromicrobium sp. NPDC092404]|uniref:D-alanyl-D-alanine carboxypeptidase/D-alanyl-D-alanine endopeptidase n=1 Tax=Aeromicrobium sp. NPDC092404 TaxID=3154976 RepID=UPI00342B09C6